jgi:hypothetical protein
MRRNFTSRRAAHLFADIFFLRLLGFFAPWRLCVKLNLLDVYSADKKSFAPVPTNAETPCLWE